MARKGNPQGKGLVPLLQTIDERRVAAVPPPKHVEQIAGELFTSLFVLRSEFRFNPVIGHRYWMYRLAGRFQLMLLPPDAWPGGHPGQLIGACTLHEDLTWSLELDAAAGADPALVALLRRARSALQRKLRRAARLADTMPVYEGQLPYHQRVLAWGLGRSLGTSMAQAGIRELSYAQARKLLTASPARPRRAGSRADAA